MSEQTQGSREIRYEPDERPPLALALGTGLQAAMVIVAPVVLVVVIVGRAADQSAEYLTWAVFAALVVSGVTTMLQSAPVWRIGSGHVLIMGTSGAFIAVCVAALAEAGPATMASLIIVSSAFQFLLASRLSLLRRLFTPVVSGTVIMLIAATVAPVTYGSLSDVPDGTDPAGPPLVAGVALAVIVTLVLRAPPALRLWSPIIGIIAGTAVAVPFGMYDVQPMLDAGWIGVPLSSWPGIAVTPSTEFWALLPAFVVVTLVGAIETIGDGVAIQRVSRRRPPATDFRVVQGALNADGLGNLLSGLAGTLPNTTYSSSISLAEVTGIASRRVGVVLGATFFVLAFFPKAAALLIAIPGPVAAAYLLVLLGLLFVQGMKIVVQEGVNHRTASVAGISFWLGVGFQNSWIFPDLLGDGFIGLLLGNGMTSGALAAVGMTAFVELTSKRRKRLAVPLDEEALPKVREFVSAFASGEGWSAGSAERLSLVAEEALASLAASEEGDAEESRGRRLIVAARASGGSAELEFVSGATSGGENLEDRLSYLADPPETPDIRETSFRLLRHYASSVRHQKYHGVDVVTLHVEGLE